MRCVRTIDCFILVFFFFFFLLFQPRSLTALCFALSNATKSLWKWCIFTWNNFITSAWRLCLWFHPCPLVARLEVTLGYNLTECSSGVSLYFGILVAQIQLGAASFYTLQFVASLYCQISYSLEKVETPEMDQCELSIESRQKTGRLMSLKPWRLVNNKTSIVCVSIL